MTSQVAPPFQKTQPHRSIRSKLLLPLLAVTGVLLFLIVGLQILEKRDDLEKDLLAHASMLVRTTAMGLSNAVWTYNAQGIERLSEGLFLDPDVRSIEVVDGNNRPLYKKVVVGPLEHGLTVSIPVLEGGADIGNLSVAFSRDGIHQELLAEAVAAVLLALVLLAAVFATTVLVVSRVLRPLKAMVGLIEDLIVAKPPTTRFAFANDEIGYVFGRFQELAASLYEKKVAVHQLAYRDSLTNLPNRAAIYSELERLLSTGESPPSPFSVHLIDIDDFKLINDTFGYRAGDTMLGAMATKLRSIKESHGVQVGRLGDDEFVVIKKDEQNRKQDFGPFITAGLAGVYEFEGLTHYLSVSVGVARFPEHGETIEDLMRNADTAMLTVKASGKGSSREFSQEMGDRLRRGIHLERHLRSALDAQELWVAFQPQWDFATGSVRSFEALLRWETQEFGFVSPADFIPLAEKTGLIVPIGDWVLDQAYQFLDRLEGLGFSGLQIAVNVSPVQLLDDGFLDRISQTVSSKGRKPASIVLEITESTFIQNLKEVQPRLRTLRDWGFGLSLDDFGTGYSSLSYLRELPFDELKIDKSFLDSLDRDSTAKGILRALVALANELRLSVVAEGVESQDQWSFLRACGCHKIQGYLLSRPLRGELALEFLALPVMPGIHG